MKCEYVGWYSRQGCNEDALPGERFCNAHRQQGRNNENASKIFGGCALVLVAFFVIFLVCTLAVT